MPITTLQIPDPITCDVHDVDIEWSYTFIPGNYSGHPDNCYPDEEEFDYEIRNEHELPDAVVDRCDYHYIYHRINPRHYHEN